MCSRFRSVWLVALTVACSAPIAAAHAGERVLRVCADPNNLPFSNAAGEGFENRLADLVARDLGATIEYTWWAERRGFVRNTLRAHECDLLTGVPQGFDGAATTRPYYRSSYVFVYRTDRGSPVRSLDDPALRTLRIGVPLFGDDAANAPPAHALARRGLAPNVRGYSVYGDYAQPNPPAALIGAVAAGDVDVAIAWGPTAGYFARRATVPLSIVPLQPASEDGVPFTFAMCLGVRRDDAQLLAEVERVLEREQPAIDALLDEYGVPRVAPPQQIADRGRPASGTVATDAAASATAASGAAGPERGP